MDSARRSPPAWVYRHPRTGEWAHDVRDPFRQARAAFAEPAATARPARAGETLRILDIGFGRGLNTGCALAGLAGLPAGARPAEVCVDACEAHPERLAPWPAPPAELADAPWWGRRPGTHTLAAPLHGRVTVRAQRAAAWLAADAPRYDWIFLDLHSPRRHPEDWDPAMWPALAAHAAPGAVLTGYCCARSVRAGLATHGWQIEVLRHDGLRDTLRARFAQAPPPA